jgi:exopolysaccharide biosynthesis polyprenyl glycosylphosphotransferase
MIAGKNGAMALPVKPASCGRTPALRVPFQRALLRLWLLFTDALALGLAFHFAYWIRFTVRVTLAPEVIPNPLLYPTIVTFLIPLSILVFLSFRLYEPHLLLGGVAEYSRVFNACSTAALIVVSAAFLRPDLVISRVWLASAWILSFLLVSASRFLCRRLVYAMRKRGYLLVRAVIVGENEEALTLARELEDWRSSGFWIAGFISAGRKADPVGHTLGALDNVKETIVRHDIEDVIVAITALGREELLRLCEAVNEMPGVVLRLSSGLYELLTTGVTVRTFNNVPLVSLNKLRLERPEVYFKRLLEYSLTISAILLLWPVFLLIAVLIKLDSAGPVFHMRRVLGVSGKHFDAFKFRTMYVNGGGLLKSNHAMVTELRLRHKLKDDPRVTRVGRFLRRYSLDELPQLFNVLSGQMSLVGPRMISPAEAERYGRNKLNLLTVTPGMTGLWQVSGRSDLSYEDRVRLDMYYIRNYSVWLDLQILFVQTLPAVLRGRGAY